MSSWEMELAFATDLARKAGEIIQAGYGRIEQIDRKSRRDVPVFVTTASSFVQSNTIDPMTGGAE